MLGTFYLALVQAVLIFGLVTWVISPHTGRMLDGFHHQVIHGLLRNKPRRQVEMSWFYLSLETEMLEAGLDEVETYVARRQNTVSQSFANIFMMDLCLAAQHHPRARVSQRWWEQDISDLGWMRVAAKEVEMARMEKEEDVDKQYD